MNHQKIGEGCSLWWKLSAHSTPVSLHWLIPNIAKHPQNSIHWQLCFIISDPQHTILFLHLWFDWPIINIINKRCMIPLFKFWQLLTFFNKQSISHHLFLCQPWYFYGLCWSQCCQDKMLLCCFWLHQMSGALINQQHFNYFETDLKQIIFFQEIQREHDKKMFH